MSFSNKTLMIETMKAREVSLCQLSHMPFEESSNSEKTSASLTKTPLAVAHELSTHTAKSSALTVSTVDDDSSSFGSFGESTVTADSFRRVRFSLDETCCIENTFALTAAERQATWYSREELIQMKAESRRVASHIRVNEKLHALVNSTHDLSIFVAEYGGENCSSADMSNVSAILSRELKAWVSASTTEGEPCRGTEKILLRNSREAFAKDARAAVTNHGCRTAADVDATAAKYKTFSRHAMAFANAMARADAQIAATTL